MKKHTIRAGKGLSEARITFARQVAGTTYQRASWWGLDSEGLALAGPCSSERKLRHEVAELRRLIASGEYAPR